MKKECSKERLEKLRNKKVGRVGITGRSLKQKSLGEMSQGKEIKYGQGMKNKEKDEY